MILSSHLRRVFLFALFFGFAFAGLGVRLYFVQVVHHDKYRGIVGDNTRRTFLKPPTRGDVLDANLHQLATCVPVKRVAADPSLIHPYQAEVARTVAPFLEMDEPALISALNLMRTNSAGVARTNRYVLLKRKVSLDRWLQITQAMAQLRFEPEQTGRKLKRSQRVFFRHLRRKGVFGADHFRRDYPSGRLASHVLGHVREVERVFTNMSSRVSTMEMRGVYGVEHWLEDWLKGGWGWVRTETDRRQREVLVRRLQDVKPRRGSDVVLTIDMFAQGIVEDELRRAREKFKAKSACSVVVRPRTGEVLAFVSLPDFDPNIPGEFSNDQRRNRVVADFHEPGSTFKIVVVSGALNEGLVDLDDVFFCENGVWRFRGRPLRDHDNGFGNLSVESIITKSSNIGAAKIAVERLGAQKLYEYMLRFGFGHKTGITLSGEIGGWVRPPDRWDGLTISRIPMGHSVTTTPLQMVMAMSAIANEGVLMRPMLIHSLRDENGRVSRRYQPMRVRRVLTREAARKMVRALKTVPAEKGTARKAALEHYTVAGKTGTAQVPGGPSGYKPRKYVSSFIGFFPADDPEVCISVLLEEPDVRKGYYGGQTAAPCFQAIAQRLANYLKIKPDKEDPLAGNLVHGTNTSPANSVAARQ